MDFVITQLGTSSSSSLTRSWTYDVFLSYRSADTHNNFTYNLNGKLLQKGIKTYLYGRGEELPFANASKSDWRIRISLIILTENFASSKWCLIELVKILQCRESKQQIVWPVYYKVDPLYVRDQQRSFGEAIANHECTFKDNIEKVLRWRAALTEATKLFGWYFLRGYIFSIMLTSFLSFFFFQISFSI